MFEDTTEERPRPRRQLVPKAVSDQNEGGVCVDPNLDIFRLSLAENGLKLHGLQLLELAIDSRNSHVGSFNRAHQFDKEVSLVPFTAVQYHKVVNGVQLDLTDHAVAPLVVGVAIRVAT